MHFSFENLLGYIALIVSSASVILFAIRFAEGVLAIWLPRSETSRVWQMLDRLTRTLEYLSVSPQRSLALRVLNSLGGPRNDKS